jgi:Helix-turn-helix domain
VVVGLANHAGLDGTGAFPSVATLVRYTGLSERTVRTCLDRLAAEGIIAPCDPGIVAAGIKRADRLEAAPGERRGDLLGAEPGPGPGRSQRAAIQRLQVSCSSA